ncbi:MAG: hypothetical protein LLG37_03360 [Spirochaetia bacterium]|nr:hypothetical protein [Spirochaetia bacterium]
MQEKPTMEMRKKILSEPTHFFKEIQPLGKFKIYGVIMEMNFGDGGLFVSLCFGGFL